MEPLLLAIDSGTTSTRALAFDLSGRMTHRAQQEIPAHFPQPGWVEQDAAAIWDLTQDVVRQVLAEAGPRVAAIGITNQRETVVFWSRASGEPLAPTIVWQDRRSAAICDQLKAAGHEPMVQQRTGLLLDPYFSATKIRWALDHYPDVSQAANRNDLMIGTIDSWLLYKLASVHLTDASNASRTSLMDLHRQQWAPELLELFAVPPSALPAICPTSGLLAEARIGGQRLSITGMAGDQQAAAIGQGCHTPGLAKCTYGTGLFMLANAGSTPPTSHNRLLATFLASDPQSFALEGSVFVAGDAIKWLRDQLRILPNAAQSEALARSVPDSGGVMFVPAFAGLGAPYWQPDARGTLTGLSSATSIAHIVRATLEAMGQQTADLIEAFAADGLAPNALKIDGGMAANDWLCQDIADITGLVVERPHNIETTALGAAMLAAVGAGIFSDLGTASRAMVHAGQQFRPECSAADRQKQRAGGVPLRKLLRG